MRLRVALVLAVGLAGLTGVACAEAQADVVALDYGLRPRAIAPGHWVLEGSVDDFNRANGCNIINTAFVATSQGVVVINTGPSRRYGEQQRRALAATVPGSSGGPGHVLNLNLHPDYFLGNQAWVGVPVHALNDSIAGMRVEGAAYAANLYRLCGDWMAGTEPSPASEVLQPGPQGMQWGSLELRRLQGHTADDLVVLDREARVAYVGGLVFKDRVPTTPHAHFASWLTSLDTLAQWLSEGAGQTWVVVPSHGPVHTGLEGVEQTRDWLQWLLAVLQDSADQGLDLSELLHTVQVPSRFARWAAQPAELHRTFIQWYPLYERRALER